MHATKPRPFYKAILVLVAGFLLSVVAMAVFWKLIDYTDWQISHSVGQFDYIDQQLALEKRLTNGFIISEITALAALGASVMCWLGGRFGRYFRSIMIVVGITCAVTIPTTVILFKAGIQANEHSKYETAYLYAPEGISEYKYAQQQKALADRLIVPFVASQAIAVLTLGATITGLFISKQMRQKPN